MIFSLLGNQYLENNTPKVILKMNIASDPTAAIARICRNVFPNFLVGS